MRPLGAGEWRQGGWGSARRRWGKALGGLRRYAIFFALLLEVRSAFERRHLLTHIKQPCGIPHYGKAQMAIASAASAAFPCRIRIASAAACWRYCALLRWFIMRTME